MRTSVRLLVVALLAALLLPLAPSPSAAQSVGAQASVSWRAGSTAAAAVSSGLTLRARSTNDGPTYTGDVGRAAAKVPSSGSLYFLVDDAYMSRGNVRDAVVEVSYFDKGFGFFYLQYDATNSSSAQSFGPSTLYLANNVVYLQDSGLWKTYRFNLANVYFGNRHAGFADFRVFYPKGGDAEIANQGYDLRVDRVMVTKMTTPVDRSAPLEGNYSGFGPPAWVWTRLGSTNEAGHGIHQSERAAPTTVSSAGGRKATAGSIYFDVDDAYLYNARDDRGDVAGSILVGLEYLDVGTGSFSVGYDSYEGERNTGSVGLTNTGGWRHRSFYLTDGRWGNGLADGTDFRIISPSNDLVVRDVVLTRPLSGNKSGPVPFGWLRTQRVVGTFYFPVFDGFRPSLWPGSTIGPPNSDPTTHVDRTYSYRSTATATKELTDMRDAGIDFAIVWYTGSTGDSNTQGVVATQQLVRAAANVPNAPKLAMMLDPLMTFGESNLRNKNELLDYSDRSVQGQMAKLVEDFYSLVPRERWATVEGRPIVVLYYQMGDMVGRYDNTALINAIAERFHATHGVRPYFIADWFWDPDYNRNLPVDEFFNWAAAFSRLPGVGKRNTYSVGPGFNGNGDVRDREGGAFYTAGWDRAIARGNHMVLIDTFNYFGEGTAIGETREYGRQYLDITREKSAIYKSRSFGATNQVRIGLGATNSAEGISQDEIAPMGLTVPDPAGGRRARDTHMWFGLDDSFVLATPTQATITVEYLDRGGEFFDVKYDGVGGEGVAGRVQIGHSGQFRSATFTVGDAYFGNRMGEATDIRIDTDRADAMVIRSLSVTVQRPPGYVPPVTKVAPPPPSYPPPALPAGWRRSYIPMGTRG